MNDKNDSVSNDSFSSYDDNEDDSTRVVFMELHEAAANGDSEKLADIIQLGKHNINEADQDWNGKTPLHWACSKGNLDCAKVLLSSGADSSPRMHGGWTPAHSAAETGKLQILKLLQTYKAPLNLIDDFGDSPKRIAQTYGHTECEQFLQAIEKEQDINQ